MNRAVTREDLRPDVMITLINRSTGARVACGKVTSKIFPQNSFGLECVGVMENFPIHDDAPDPQASALRAHDLSIWCLQDIGVTDGTEPATWRSTLVATIYQPGDEDSI